ncbi:MAG TPA: glutamate-1-semialdehyde 2,1-aminomutase [Bacteroidales bacterium]|nr:glutamate-1-semialdehyde 2,1-aminomutase [Bacteroidales bacterium]
MKYTESLKLQKKFNDLIPGGSHTYAKGDDQFPEFMPAYIDYGKGCHVWDVDGNEFIEYGMGLRSVTLGHAFEPVVKAAHEQMLRGNNFVRPARIELECAEEFLGIIEGADMVKFSKDGSDANNGAVKLARAYTGRDLVAVCANHPFFSVDDWFIGSTPMSAGIPEIVKSLTIKFLYNNIGSVEKMFAEHPGKISCVILEAEKYDAPVDNFLHKLKDMCHKNGALFILDEMITGFRWHLGGAQKKYNIVPDLSTFGKALGNGFAISALAGKREFMELGGLHHKKERVFLISTTHGAENHALAAALATLKFYKEHDVISHLYEQGRKFEEGVMRSVGELKLEGHVSVIGPHCCSVYTTADQDKKPSQPFRTLFIQETMKRGLLMPSSIVSYSHSDKDMQDTVERIHESLIVYKKALNEGIEKYLEGKPVQPVFRKFN